MDPSFEMCSKFFQEMFDHTSKTGLYKPTPNLKERDYRRCMNNFPNLFQSILYKPENLKVKIMLDEEVIRLQSNRIRIFY